MGNLITHRALDPDLQLAVDLSNGGTSVLLSVLLLAGSHLARDPWEHRLLLWLATHDQTIVGSGMVGFDLGELAWTGEGFAEQKRFLLETIDLARGRHGWEKLGYEPPFAAGYLEQLRRLVVAFEPEHVGVVPPRASWSWPADRSEFPRCAEHGVVRGWFDNCLLCDDRPRG